MKDALQEVYIGASDGLRRHEVVCLEADTALEIGGQGSLKGGDNFRSVLDGEFDARIVACEFNVVVTCRSTDL